MSPTVAVFATLALILIVPRKVPMWVSFLGACVALPLLAGKGLAGSWDLWSASLTDAGLLNFMAICFGVFVLSSILTHGGHLAALCGFASAVIPSRRIRAAVMPALVGLVPMPGGAVVSAPLIDRSLGGTDVSATDKNLINYWFRHIWEVSWPLYPAVLVAAAFALRGGSQGRFFAVQAGLTGVLAIAGYFALLRRVPPGDPDLRDRTMPPVAELRAVVPILALAILPAVLKGLWRGPDTMLFAVIAANVLALLTTIRFAGLSEVLKDRRVYSLTALTFGVAILGELVRGVGAADELRELVVAGRLPLWLFVPALPFLIGFATGATLSFVAVAFPIVEDLRSDPGIPLPWLVLAYAGGFLGYLTSPVHMCLVLSTRYFNSKLLSAYARLALPLLAFLAAAVGLFLLLGGRFDA